MYARKDLEEKIPRDSVKSFCDVNFDRYLTLSTQVNKIDGIRGKGNACMDLSAWYETELIMGQYVTNESANPSSNNLGVNLVREVIHHNGAKFSNSDGLQHLRNETDKIRIHNHGDLGGIKDVYNSLCDIRSNDLPTRVIKLTPKNH